MANGYSVAELLEFLNHAAEKGLMPAATAQALAVASRNVFGILADTEAEDVRKIDLDGTFKRFTNKRAGDFSPASLREYGSRVRRAVEHFVRWRDNPSAFAVKTRVTKASGRRDKAAASPAGVSSNQDRTSALVASAHGSYHTAIPIRPGQIVTISNVPEDLTAAEAEKLAAFITMLSVKG